MAVVVQAPECMLYRTASVDRDARRKGKPYLRCGQAGLAAVLLQTDCILISSDDIHLPGRGGGASPLWVFSEMAAEPWVDRTETLRSLWGILFATFGKAALTDSVHVTEL